MQNMERESERAVMKIFKQIDEPDARNLSITLDRVLTYSDLRHVMNALWIDDSNKYAALNMLESHVEDSQAEEIADIVASSSTLLTLNLQNNHFTFEGYRTILGALVRNTSVRSIFVTRDNCHDVRKIDDLLLYVLRAGPPRSPLSCWTITPDPVNPWGRNWVAPVDHYFRLKNKADELGHLTLVETLLICHVTSLKHTRRVRRN